jgi:DNA-binding response OmpR family regulator
MACESTSWGWLMGKRVLVVDDHPPTVELIRDALVREGFSVVSAGNGADCLRKVEAHRPDLVILDIVMPVMDGIKSLRALRANPETKNLPVIVLTVRTKATDVLAGWTAGADLYLTKPCKIQRLVAAVKRVLGAPAYL